MRSLLPAQTLRRAARSLAVVLLLVPTFTLASAALTPATTFAADSPCVAHDFFGLPPWYKYLNQEPDPANPAKCRITAAGGEGTGGFDLMSIWLIAFAVLEALMRIIGVLAVGFVIYGGFRFITSQGSPENTKAARNTIINALIGLTIAIIAAVGVSFIAGRLA